MITIRPATPWDAQPIRALWNALIRDTDITFTSVEKTIEDVSAYLCDHAKNGDPVLVAVHGTDVAGYASYHPFPRGDGYRTSREVTINLNPAFRFAGHGARLLEHLEAHAREQNVHCLIAGITATNAPSRRFFAKHGFKDAGVLPEIARKFDKWHDLVLMQKFL